MSAWTSRDSNAGKEIVVAGADEPGYCAEVSAYGNCTRPKHHAGRHMASVGNDRIISAWPGDHAPSTSDLDS